jgi:hypothetical protein
MPALSSPGRAAIRTRRRDAGPEHAGQDQDCVLNALRWSMQRRSVYRQQDHGTLKIRDAVKPGTTWCGPAPLGPGEYEINIYPLSEILPGKDLRNWARSFRRLRCPQSLLLPSQHTSNAAGAGRCHVSSGVGDRVGSEGNGFRR